jgi:hypothetical protein
MGNVMSETAYKEWLPKGWDTYKKQISEFLSLYGSISEKDSKKLYKELVKELSVDVRVLGSSIPKPVEGYKGLSIRLDKSNLDNEKKSTEDLGLAVLFMGYQLVEDPSRLNLLFDEIKEEGRLERITELIDHVQKVVDGKSFDEGPSLEDRARMPD